MNNNTGVQLFCYGCVKHHLAGTAGATIVDSRGNERWCCAKCASAKLKAGARLVNGSVLPHGSRGRRIGVMGLSQRVNNKEQG
jgi:Zn-finger protein